MRHEKAIEWEKRLKTVFDEIDAELEEDYGGTLPLHPARAPEGATSNPEADGLFNVGAAYSAGFGSRYGPGYVVEIRLATLAHIPHALKKTLMDQVEALLDKKLPEAFPGKELHVDREFNYLRIHGDLGLD